MFQLLFNKDFQRIEKIKVISSTFMAACGLQPGRKGSSDSAHAGAYGRLGSASSLISPKFGAAPPGVNARTMAEFAALMIRNLKRMKFEKFEVKKKPDFSLRIGMLIA